MHENNMNSISLQNKATWSFLTPVRNKQKNLKKKNRSKLDNLFTPLASHEITPVKSVDI